MSEKRPSEELPAFDDPADLVNAVVSTLQVPEERTNVAMTYANDKNVASEVQAYAKIAGRDWTYYVKSLAISIGRNTDNSPAQPPSGSVVQIDLGPAKVVSRQHAAITYNIDLRCWELKVLGRNGARIDGVKMPVGHGSATPLHSGAILDVGGTQMMFILPDTPPSISQKMLQTCLARYKGKVAKTAPNAPFSRFSNGFVSHSTQNSLGSMFDKTTLSQSPQRAAVSLQNNLDQDLSSEKAKGIKPPYSYATMITQAILSDPEGVMSLSEIYEWISSHYAYYKYSKAGWQNSIRHNLSLNKAFEKVPRKPNEPGKGMKWQISETYRAEFMKKVQTGTLSKSRRGSSVSRTLQIHLATHSTLPDPAKNPIKPEHSRNGSLENPQMQYAVPVNTYMPQMYQQSYYYNQGPTPQMQGSLQPQMQSQMQPQMQGQMGQPPQMPQMSQVPMTQGMGSGMNQSMGQNAAADQGQAMSSGPGNQAQAGLAPRGLMYNQASAQASQKTMVPGSLMPPKEQAEQAELASPLRHGSSLDNAKQKPSNNNVFGQAQSRTYGMYKVSGYEASDGNRNSFSNTSNQNTSESMIQTSTAPTTSNTSELGLGFTSPKKIAPLEAFTPERGSKTFQANGKGANANQSSPAFWNFVQFSTPNGQTPGRRISDDGQGSPTLSRGNGKILYDDSPSNALPSEKKTQT